MVLGYTDTKLLGLYVRLLLLSSFSDTTPNTDLSFVKVDNWQIGKDSLIISEDKLVVSIGLENVVIVETRDAVLVSKKNCLDSLKEVVSSLNKKGFDEAQNHKKVYRPWGSFLSLEAGDSWQIKKIDVNPGASLSLQKHLHRSEHWVVVCGTAKIEIGNIEKRIGTNESAYIPLGVKHRLSNPTDLPLVLIEIQSGSYLGEDDIERFEDLYQR